MIKEGLLDKFGKPNEKTPSDWLTIKEEPVEATDAAPAKKVLLWG